MEYLSTRGYAARQKFCDILLEGLAPDGGLYLPQTYPQISNQQLQTWREIFSNQGYAALAYQILTLYIDDIPSDDLKSICNRTYTADIFGSSLITPVRKHGDQLFILELSNGPTLAFKDMAMQLLGNLFEYELGRRSAQLNILGATSGDTGSAAEYAMRGKKGVRVFMTSPHGRMSRFQQAQMFSLQDSNIFNMAIKGVFDDCQDIVKSVSNDLNFKQQFKIGTVNSINWARLLAQVVYYFAAYFQVTNRNDERIDFTVPSGNFGNVCAGHVARMMGLPIHRLIVATNENDVLDEFFKTGLYKVRSSANTFETSSPSMDISKASNFERFIFDLLNRDAQRTAKLFTSDLQLHGQFNLREDKAFDLLDKQFGFSSGKSTHGNRLQTIRDSNDKHQHLIDPHTADGVFVAQSFVQSGTPMVVLETALPAKFSRTIEEAIGHAPELPAQFAHLESLPQKVEVMNNDVNAVKDFIAMHCSD